MTSHPNSDNMNPSQMDELLSQQEEVIQELEKLEKQLLQTIEEFRASISKEAPGQKAEQDADSAEVSERPPASLPKAA